MNPSALLSAVTILLLARFAGAEVPKRLAMLDLSALDFPNAAEAFLTSPQAETLSFHDAFFLLGACEMIDVPDVRDDIDASIELRKKMSSVTKRARRLAWRRAEASNRNELIAYAERQRAAVPNLPADKPTQTDPVLTWVDGTKLEPAFSGSEALEWCQLETLRLAAQIAKTRQPAVSFPLPAALAADVREQVPQTLHEPLAAFLAVASDFLTNHPDRPPAGWRRDSRGLDWQSAVRIVSAEGIGKAVEENERSRKDGMVIAGCYVGTWKTLPSLTDSPELTRLLEASRWKEVTTRALFAHPSSNSEEGDEQATRVRWEILSTVYPRWEEVVLGKHVFQNLFLKHKIDLGVPGKDFWECISTPRGAAWALDYVEWADTFHQEIAARNWLPLLDVKVDYDGTATKLHTRSQPLPAAVKDRIVAKYARLQKTEGFFRAMQTEIDVFAAVDAPESRRQLRAYLEHPSSTIANRAAAALRAFGEEAKDRPPEDPLVIRFTVGKEPLTNRRVAWQKRYVSAGEPSGGVYRQGKTDALGELRIPRDFFHEETLQRGAPRYLSVSVATPAERKHSHTNGQGLAFFVPYPKDFDKPLELDAQMVEPVVTINSAPDLALPPGRKVIVSIYPVGPADAGSIDGGSFIREQVPLGATKLKPIQSGKVNITIEAGEGIAFWREIIELTPASALVTVTLQQGTSITVRLPDEVYNPLFPHKGLLLKKDGKVIDSSWTSASSDFSGNKVAKSQALPLGNYQVQMISSADWIQSLRSTEVWHGPHFNSDEKEFRITRDVAPMLDLGQFEFKPVK